MLLFLLYFIPWHFATTVIFQNLFAPQHSTETNGLYHFALPNHFQPAFDFPYKHYILTLQICILPFRENPVF
ncbi:hypothetical protein HanPSC8_Chr10g0410421 [Helianthus annuus]|nr:hypothetical protein HanPSC8_Chr10g0410421 [Helianthus annuus]